MKTKLLVVLAATLILVGPFGCWIVQDKCAERVAVTALRSTFADSEKQKRAGIPDVFEYADFAPAKVDWIGRNSVVTFMNNRGDMVFVDLWSRRGLVIIPLSFSHAGLEVTDVEFYSGGPGDNKSEDTGPAK